MTNLFESADLSRGLPTLDDLPWGPVSYLEALDLAETILRSRSTADHIASLAHWLDGQSARQWDSLTSRSQERSTHFKWCLARVPGKYNVWLHQYKPPQVYASAARWASSIHSHRYAFVSTVLAGRLHTRWFVESADETAVPVRDDVYNAGAVYRIDTTDIHAISEVGPDTVTLVVQTDDLRKESVVFDPDSGRRIRAIPALEDQVGELVDRLVSGSTGRSEG